ncbi:hemerythrin domain-containing protein [Sphingomonas cannabina]|uniref:hemerythrin domain-containing protein n=1 Tax=Sphingomonas cannabina TaxID=2899123 RepID=UPI001F36FBBB|nr:hemerythrin domain-containing protein [Sphingomonas cannabina]UIJ46227.1 hemerythrin domain-containing protein [Sphingomonas cannabina]
MREPLDTVKQDRRTALGLMAGTGVTASVLLLPGCSPLVQKSEEHEKDRSGEVAANEDLMREHGVLRRILIVYREIAPRLAAGSGPIDAGAIASAAALFREFGEHYHEQLLEEQHVFPLVRKAGGEGAGLIDMLMTQHQRGRAITDYILDRTKGGKIATGQGEVLANAMTAFSRMYEAHAAHEDTVIFPAFKASLGQKSYDELGEQFEEIEHQRFGGDGFDMALDKVVDIEHALGIADLGAFTAPAPPAL